MPRWRIEAIDEMLMIEPPPCRAITGMTCFMARKALLRLTANTRSQSASETSTTFPVSAMPTLLSSTSMRPKVLRHAATIASTSAARETSAVNAVALPPSEAMIFAVSSAAAPLRSTQNTCAPSRAKVTAVALPLPQPGPIEPAPTTSAVFPLSRSIENHRRVCRIPSLKRHVQAFRDVGAEAGGDGDAAAEFPRGGIAGPHRIAAGAEKRIGVGRLGFGGVERIIGIGVEDAGSFGAAAVGLDVDHFLVVPRQREADLAPEIFGSLDVEQVGVGFAGRGIEFSGAQAAAAGNSLIIGELEVIRLRDRNQRHPPQRYAQTNFHDVFHPNRPYDIFLQTPVLNRNRNIVTNRNAGNHKGFWTHAPTKGLVVLTRRVRSRL